MNTCRGRLLCCPLPCLKKVHPGLLEHPCFSQRLEYLMTVEMVPLKVPESNGNGRTDMHKNGLSQRSKVGMGILSVG